MAIRVSALYTFASGRHSHGCLVDGNAATTCVALPLHIPSYYSDVPCEQRADTQPAAKGTTGRQLKRLKQRRPLI